MEDNFGTLSKNIVVCVTTAEVRDNLMTVHIWIISVVYELLS